MGRDINDVSMAGGADAVRLAVANGRNVLKKSERKEISAQAATSRPAKRKKQQSGEGKPSQLNAKDIEDLLRADTTYEVARDQFLGELMRRRRGSDLEWERWTDTHLTELRVEFNERGYATPSKELTRDVVSMVADYNKFDSAIEWANSLSWDGVGRIATFAHVYLKAPLNAYTQSVSHYLWTALAGRVIEPGCQCDYVPVLVSRKEGLRKTTTVGLLAPAPEFAGSIRMDMKPDDLSRKMRGKVVLEWAEMAGLKTRDAESVKDFVTNRVEEWVEKYQTHTTRYPRRNLIIGTTNDVSLLPAYGDGRRWFPLELHEVIDTAALERDRDQLWAEAIHTFKHFGVLWQDADLLARGVRDDYREEDPRETTVRRWLAQTSREHQYMNGDLPFETADLQKALLDAGHRRYDDRTLPELLESLGFEKRKQRVSGKPVWRWYRRAGRTNQ